MRLPTARRIDDLIGTPLCWVLNWAARLLGTLLRRDHSLDPPPRRILVIKLLGMGSIVIAGDVLTRLKRRNPDMEIRFLTFASNRELLERIPVVDLVWCLRDRSLVTLLLDTMRAMPRIWRWRPEMVIDLEVYAKASTVLTTLTLAQNRLSFFVATTRFRRGLNTHLIYMNRFQRVHDAYAQIIELLTTEPAKPRPDIEKVLRLRDDDHDDCAAMLRSVGVKDHEELICIDPNASELCLERRWPAENVAALVGVLARLTESRIGLIGSPSERAYTESIRAAVPPAVHDRVVDLAGKTSLGGLLSLLERARLLITNDSGPMHLAEAMGTPVLSLWGPSSPQSYGKAGARHHTIYKSIYCSPCLLLVDKPPCHGDNQCMKRITVREVAAEALSLLGESLPEDAIVPEPQASLRTTQLGVVRLREESSRPRQTR